MKAGETAGDTNPTSRPQGVADARCRIEILGPLRVVRGDQVITRFARQKAVALLAYLAVRLGPHTREHLIDLFWPDLDAPAGRDNLSTTLGSLRRQLEPPGVRRGSVLITTNTHVNLNPEAVVTDVADFERLLRDAQRAETPAARADILQQAVALHRDQPLPGLYADWVVSQAERQQARLLEALNQLAEDLENMGDQAGALECVRRASSLDPYSEELFVWRVRLCVQTGQAREARQARRKFQRLFAEEFGTAPSPETRKTVARLLAQSARSSQSSSEIPGAVPPPAELPREAPEPAGAAPPSKSAPAGAPAIPTVLSRFFGREWELSELARLLLPSKSSPIGPDLPEGPVRLVTLIGPGGIGKTRLALEFSRQASERYGCWRGFVSLADITAAGQIADEIAATLRISPDPRADLLAEVTAFLRQTERPAAPSLLVLDNLEHLLPVNALPSLERGHQSAGAPDAAGVVQALLDGAPGLTILCTSRRRLGLRGERLLAVGSLPVPAAPRTTIEPEALAMMAGVPSVRLYLDRAQAVRADFGLTPTNAPAVAALCRQVDGSPLALELAAAWVRVLPPRRMWERLTQGLDIPAGSYADLPDRHRSLSAVMDWSWRLLRPSAQRLLARLAVFQGGWTAEAAEAVCDEPEAFDLLAELEEASLVTTAEGEAGEVRYRFPETVRAFARQRAEEYDEGEIMRRRHADHFRALAEEAEPQLRGPEQTAWLERLEAEHDNLRAALEFSLADGDGIAGLEIAAALVRFWRVHGHWTEGRRWLKAALDRTGASGPTALRAKGLNGSGAMAHLLGDFAEAQACYEQALALRRQLGERGSVADSLHNLGYLALLLGDFARAQTLYEEALAIQRELGDALAIADEVHHLGLLAHEQGDVQRAQFHYEESLSLRTPLGDLRGMTLTLANLANIAYAQNDYSRAQALHEKVLAAQRELGDQQGIGLTLNNLARTASSLGDMERAQTLYWECVTTRIEIGDRVGLLDTLEGMAIVAHDRGHSDRAVTLLTAAEALRISLGVPGSDASRQTREQCRESIRAALSEAAYVNACAAGQRMTLAEAAVFALAE